MVRFVMAGRARALSFAVLLVLSLASCSGAVSGSTDTVRPPVSPTPAEPKMKTALGSKYATNDHGQTYGTLSTGVLTPPEDYPDLVGVVASNGNEGYALASDVFGDLTVPDSPGEAVERNTSPSRVPVFQSDGQTQVGWFTTR